MPLSAPCPRSQTPIREPASGSTVALFQALRRLNCCGIASRSISVFRNIGKSSRTGERDIRPGTAPQSLTRALHNAFSPEVRHPTASAIAHPSVVVAGGGGRGGGALCLQRNEDFCCCGRQSSSTPIAIINQLCFAFVPKRCCLTKSSSRSGGNPQTKNASTRQNPLSSQGEDGAQTRGASRTAATT